MPGYRNRASLSELAARAYAALDGAYRTITRAADCASFAVGRDRSDLA
jgi:hypothetical protein